MTGIFPLLIFFGKGVSIHRCFFVYRCGTHVEFAETRSTTMANNKHRRRRKRLRRRRRKQQATAATAVAKDETRDPRNRWLNLTARGGLRLGWRGTGRRFHVELDETAPAQLLASLAPFAPENQSPTPAHGTPHSSLLTQNNGKQHEN
jgi:hypothetical protein